MTDYPDDPISLLFQLGLGPWVTPLRGKIPTLDAWSTREPVDEATVRGWVASGLNLGLRTGARSQVIVIDDDRVKHGLDEFDAPPTGLIARSPTGSTHYYYRCPAVPPRNSASHLAPKVDVRGEGGQVVVPPSIHPTEREEYRWAALGEPGPFPADLFRVVTVDMTPPPASTGQGYAETALKREVERVEQAPQGQGNDTLVKAAFNLGQLVAGGVLSREVVEESLMAAATLNGRRPEKEARATIQSGLRGGSAKPRGVPERHPAVTTSAPERARKKREILVPGSHTLEGGEYVEQGNDRFSSQVLEHLPPDAIYRRAGTIGEIQDGQFSEVKPHRMRSIIDAGVKLVSCKADDTKDGTNYETAFRVCSRDAADLVLGYAAVRGSIRDLKHIASHPVYVGSDFQLAKPGWNEASGVYLTSTLDVAPLELDYAKAVLEDLVCDFPFQADADRENYFGLLLTPLLRPAINEPVPMHLIGSPIERSGKTKLAEIVLGCIIAGRRTPAMQLGDREEEREKRIMAVLMRGQTILHLDNLSDFLDSASLASLLTSSEYQGRILGASAAPTLTNGLTVVGTGNNVHATGEISKRIVPVRLLPNTDAPESRTDFRHPDLLSYCLDARERVLGALVGLVENWRAAGRPLHRGGFGGFERWTAVVGGILGAAGYSQWLTSMAEWRSSADDSTQEHAALVRAWHERYACAPVSGGDIYALAIELDLYGWLGEKRSDRGQRTSFGRRVLSAIAGRIICGYRVESEGVGGARRMRLTHP